MPATAVPEAATAVARAGGLGMLELGRHELALSFDDGLQRDDGVGKTGGDFLREGVAQGVVRERLMEACPGRSPLLEFRLRAEAGLDFGHVWRDAFGPRVREVARAFEVEADLDSLRLAGEPDLVVYLRGVVVELQPDAVNPVGQAIAETIREAGQCELEDERHEVADPHYHDETMIAAATESARSRSMGGWKPSPLPVVPGGRRRNEW